MIHVITSDAALQRLRLGATVVRSAPAVFRVEGPGALTCLQGLLTNDIDTPGTDSLVYGALLTPKGMIVVDLWVLRDAEGFTLIAPVGAREAALALFRRSLPPRLARLTDRTEEWAAAWLLGAGVAASLRTNGFAEMPLAGTTTSLPHGGMPLALAAGTATAWFQALLLGPSDPVDSAISALTTGGMTAGTTDEAEAARILAGWPALGAEIGEKTLPQEVGFDELGGVSYTKGCYTGQETVARVHFRGHPNRELRGVVWQDCGDLSDEAVISEEKEIGRITSLVETPTCRMGLGVLRREIAPGTTMSAGGRPAKIVALPFPLEIASA